LNTGANPTIASYNAIGVKIYNATGILVRFEKDFFFKFEKRSSLLCTFLALRIVVNLKVVEFFFFMRCFETLFS
jgi:hypothetical protein